MLPNLSREVIVASDQSGNANVGVGQLNLQPGINRVNVEIFRPVNPLDPNSPPVTVAKTETTIDWQAPQVNVAVDLPATVVVNQDIPATVTVTNNGKVDSQTGDVSLEIPAGMSFVRSVPEPASIQNGIVSWRLSSLGSGRQQSIQATFRAPQSGVFSTTALAKTADGLQAQKAASLRVDVAQLQIKIDTTRTALVGESISLPITVTNPGTGPANNLSIEVMMQDGLEVTTPAGPVRGKVVRPKEAPLAANETRAIPFRCTPRQPGSLQLSVFARADGDLQAQAVCTITAQAPQLEIRRQGPPSISLNKDGSWDVHVLNAGQTPLNTVVLRERLPAELTLRNASDGSQFNQQSGEIIWNFGTLNAGEERIVRYTATGARLTTRGILSGTVTASPNVEQKSENTIQVLGVPAVRVDVTSSANPIEVGQRCDYTIRVVNQGTLPANQIDVSATVTPLLQILAARGPQNGVINGQTVTFPSLNSLQPGQAVTLVVTVQALNEGDARFSVKAQTQTSPAPLLQEQATRIIPAQSRNP